LNRPIRLCWVASINDVKDPWTMIDVADQLCRQGLPYELDVIGEDTLAGRVQREAARRGLDHRIRFHGYLAPARLRATMERAHVHLLTSRFEGGARVVLEAAATGVPTVGTDVPFVSELAPRGAVVLPVGDAPGLASAVAELARDEPRRVRLAVEAQEVVLRETARIVTKRLESVYRALIEKQSKAAGNA